MEGNGSEHGKCKECIGLTEVSVFLTGCCTNLCTDGWLEMLGKHLLAWAGYYACTRNVSIVFLQERIQADEVIAILDQEQHGKHGLNINPKDEL